MHIPDGYISPGTCAVFYAAMAPAWYMAAKKAERSLRLKELPLLSLGAAFAFVIMMFNIPVPGGSSGHMAGAVVVAATLGPWAGVVAMSIALALQAILFGDGGITSFGANAFNMALLMSFTGYYVYKIGSLGEPGPARRFAAAALGGYVAVNLAAFAVAVELGVQPLIAHAVDGRPLYAPYLLSISIPAMMLPHLLFFGPVEALGTGLVISYLHKAEGVLARDRATGRTGSLKPLWAAIIIMMIIVPIGLLATGTPWGEWGKEDMAALIGYVPEGMDRLGGLWSGVLPDYGVEGATGASSVLFYVVSALVGSTAVMLAVFFWGKLWRR